MSSRETAVLLDSGLSLHTAIQLAVADRYHVTKVRMATTVHNAVVHNIQWKGREDDEGMKPLIAWYDPSCRADLKHGDECGTLLGKPVFLDDTLKPRLLIVESEPIPAE